jgi:hypothetical protein
MRAPVPTLAFAEGAAVVAHLPRLGDAHRGALGTFLRLLARGERVAQRMATRQAKIATEPRMVRFLRSQARQEHMHALIFDGFARALGAPSPRLDDDPYRIYALQLQDAADRGDFHETVLGTQVVLEALGEVLLERLDRGIARRGDFLLRLRRRILAQEAAHHAFGEAILAAATTADRQCSPRRNEDILQHYLHHASALIDHGAPVLAYFGVSATTLQAELCERVHGSRP